MIKMTKYLNILGILKLEIPVLIEEVTAVLTLRGPQSCQRDFIMSYFCHIKTKPHFALQSLHEEKMIFLPSFSFCLMSTDRVKQEISSF